MICYKDETFCINPNCTGMKHAKLTEQVKKDAEKWWGKPDTPIAMADLCEGKAE